MKIMASGFLSIFLICNQVYAKSININPLLTGMNSSYVGLEDAALNDQAFSNKRSPNRLFLYTTYHWDKEPWVIMYPDGKTVLEPVVSDLNTLDVGFSWLFNDNLQFSIDGFVAIVGVDYNFGGRSNIHTGDTRIQLKYRLFESSSWNFAVAPELTLPTGVGYRGNSYGASISNSSYAPGLKFISEYIKENNQITLNLGYTHYDQAEFKSSSGNYPRIDGRARIFIGAGWLYHLSKRWSVDTEYSTQTVSGKNHFTPPGLITIGGRYQPADTISWHFGAGTGSIGKSGGNDPVFYAGLKIPFFEATEPPQKKEEPTPKPTEIVAQDKSLYSQEELAKTVIYKKEFIQVLNEVEFDLNMSNLTPRGRQIVQQVAKVILDHKEDIKHVNVDGHTDHQGTNKINDPLSQARAETVVNELVSMGVSKTVLTAKGYGSHKPIYDYKKTKPLFWERNRRVEFHIIQSDQ